MKKLFTTVLVLILAISVKNASGQTDPTPASIQELEDARALLSDMEDSFGLVNPRLLEPIENLADTLIQLEQYDEADEHLDRAIRIIRAEGGLYTEYQRPLFVKKVENYSKQGDWGGARENLEHLSWLYTTKSIILDEKLVEDLLLLSHIHLRALVEDLSFFQGYHLTQSARTQGMALAVAKSIWGATDERIVPMIYDQLRLLHMQTSALWHGGPASLVLRQEVATEGAYSSRYDLNEAHYLAGLLLLDELVEIYAEDERKNLEGLAMAKVYLADWHILYDKPREAEETYRLAYEGLLTAGVEASVLDELFSQPLIIPDTRFYAAAEDAVVAKQNKIVTLGDQETQDYLMFREWSSELPNVRSPIDEDEQDLDSNYALFSFRLAGVNEIAPWSAYRFTKSLSMIEQAQLLEHYIEPLPAELSLLEKLNSLSFRPKLVGGEPQQAEGRLKYQIADEHRWTLR